MATWLILLRGINVGGKNILPMSELVRTLAKAGYTNVKTYIQSGNVVLWSPNCSADTLAKHIGEVICESHGLQPSVITLSVEEINAVADSNPYAKIEANPKSVHLFFLDRVPSQDSLDSLNRLKSESESFQIVDKVLYFHAPDGIGRSKFAKGAERAMGVHATARNWRTVGKLIELANEADRKGRCASAPGH